MTITIELPDALKAVLFANGEEPARSVLGAVALEGFRSERLTESDVRQLLGFQTRMEVHEFLKRHGAFMHYTRDDLEHDTGVAVEVAGRIRSQRQAGSELPTE